MYGLINQLGVGVAAQRDGRIVYANAALANLLRYVPATGLLQEPVSP